jgi:integrase/recombinase XerD
MVTGSMSLAGAITALAAEKRAVGYKYDAEERVLARFEAFCRAEFPGLGTVTRASAEAWITSARQRGVRPATLQGLAACCPALRMPMKASLMVPMCRPRRVSPGGAFTV